ncbi:MAG: DUF1203 domain-containing protein [Chthoniobacterales bacterium]
MKNSFRIVPVDTNIAAQARRIAAAGRPDHKTVVADSPHAAPCRHCLRWADPGEAMILFPYQSIPADHPYGESGPIFVHKEPCHRYSAVDVYPAAFRDGRVLRGYNAQSEIVAAEVPGDDPEGTIEAMLAKPEISFLHVRSITHGCYTMKVERV